MSKVHTILIGGACFVVGCVFSTLLLREKISETNKAIDEFVHESGELLDWGDRIRNEALISELGGAIQAMATVVDVEARGAPYDYRRDEYINLIRARATRLKEEMDHSQDEYFMEEGEKMLTKAEDLLLDIELHF